MTNHTLEQILKNLINEVQINHFNNVEYIDASLAEISTFNDYSVIRPLARLLDDYDEYYEVIFSIIHNIESFPEDIYISEIIKEFPFLIYKAPHWAVILLIRILNSNSARECITKKIYLTTPEIKSSILFLLHRINEENPKFSEKIVSLMKAANPADRI